MNRLVALVMGLSLSMSLLALAPPGLAAVHVAEAPAESWRVDGRVYATKIVGDLVFVGGSFTAATSPSGETAPRHNLAAFRLSDGALVGDWRADVSNTVRVLESDGSSLWVGGHFGRVGGVHRPRLAKLDVATGEVDRGFHAHIGSGGVRGLALGDAGELFVGGLFTSVAGESRNRLAKVDGASGDLVRAFAPDADDRVLGLAVAGTRLYAVGRFSSIGGVRRTGVAGVDAVTGEVTGPAYPGSVRPSRAVDVDDTGSRLFVAGAARANNAQAWDAETGERLWRRTAMGDVQAIEHFEGTVYFGFHEGFQEDLSVRLLAAEAATGQLDETFRPSFDRFVGVLAIDASEAGLVAGGEFTRVEGVRARGWARWPSSGSTPPPPPPPTSVEPVGASTQWRYLDNGTRPVGWHQPGFDDGSWALGLPELGYGDGDETTVVSYGPDKKDKHVTTYFRTTFGATGTATSLEVDLLADDGAVVYLNGVEVVRDNLPTGEITHQTRASRARCCGGENRFRTFTVPASALVVGTNTVAVEVHQQRPGSSDLGFDLRLRGEFS